MKTETVVPFLPLSFFITPSFSIPIEATLTLSTITILSPDWIPNF